MPVLLEQKKLLGKFRLTSTLIIATGLHIGGGGENLDIGGLDKPIIRDPLTQYPYIPGSSLKGKLRSILERLLNKPLNRMGGSDTYRYESDDLEDGYTEVEIDQFIPYEGAKTCPISRLFGSTGSSCWIKSSIAREQGLLGSNNLTRTIGDEEYAKIRGRNVSARLLIRDCHLQPESAQRLKAIDTGLYMTEWKFENGIDRITAAANPRQLERVPAGAAFNFELVYNVEDYTQAVEDFQNLTVALTILEDDSLGGHGSRGYGKVKFKDFDFTYYDYQAYRDRLQAGVANLQDFAKSFSEPVAETSELLTKFSLIQQRLFPTRNANNE